MNQILVALIIVCIISASHAIGNNEDNCRKRGCDDVNNDSDQYKKVARIIRDQRQKYGYKTGTPSSKLTDAIIVEIQQQTGLSHEEAKVSAPQLFAALFSNCISSLHSYAFFPTELIQEVYEQ